MAFSSNSGRFSVIFLWAFGGSSHIHTINSLLYPPMPHSQSSEYIMTAVLLNTMLLRKNFKPVL